MSETLTNKLGYVINRIHEREPEYVAEEIAECFFDARTRGLEVLTVVPYRDGLLIVTQR